MSWKLAVSTLGMPGVTVPEAVRTALAHGCDGLEVRAHPDEEVHLGLSEQRAKDVGGRIREAGLEVSCLAGYAKVCAPGPDGPVIAELRELIELAARIGAPSLRVFPGGLDGGDGSARERIGAVLPDLRAHGVRLLLETHDSHPTGESAMRLAEPHGDPGSVAVLWDALHPWRSGEAPERTRAELGNYLGYFQVKDAIPEGDRWFPVPPDEGRVPLDDCGSLLRSWSGWISLEWELAWHPKAGPVSAPLRATAEWFRRWNPRD